MEERINLATAQEKNQDAMTARIIPIKRFPRQMGMFDYAMPDALREKICVGQLITVPFRTGTIFGLVSSLDRTTHAHNKLKTIASIVNEEPLVSEQHLQFLNTMSAWHGVSIGTMAKLAILPLQKKKLKNLELSKLTSQTTLYPKPYTLNPATFHFYRTPAEHAAALTEAVHGATLILVPRVHLIAEVLSLLPQDLRSAAIIWHGDLSPKEQCANWLVVRNQSPLLSKEGLGVVDTPRIIIGTRSAVFLPFQAIENIIIDYEHDEQHKQWDSQPRYHALDVATSLASIYGADLHHMSFSPSFASYAAIYDGALGISGLPAPAAAKDLLFSKRTEGLPRITDMRDERNGKNFGLFADAALAAMYTCRDDMVFLVNRLGFATAVLCSDCGYCALCTVCKEPMTAHAEGKELRCRVCGATSPIPLVCPACDSTLVRLRGTGTETVETELRRQLGDTQTHTIVRIDSAANPVMREQMGEQPICIIGTDMALPHIRWDRTDLIIMLDIDHRISLPEYRAREDVWHLVQEIQYRRKKECEFFIQTFDKHHALFRSLAEPDRFYRTELSTRKMLGYPPYRYLVRYLVPGDTMTHAHTTAKQLMDTLRPLLTALDPDAILRPPIETQPPRARGRYWVSVTVAFHPRRASAICAGLPAALPDGVIIDPHPISLCSPS